MGVDGDDVVWGCLGCVCPEVVPSFWLSVSVVLSQPVIELWGMIFNEVGSIPVGVEWILSASMDESVVKLWSSCLFSCFLVVR